MTRFLIALVAIFPLLTGCGSGSTGGTLSGAVTVDGKPLKRGSVRLDPEGGTGAPVGGTVRDGKYEVKGVKPGKYKIHVEGEPESSGPVSQEEVMKRTEKEHKAATENPVPVGATGNDETVEVTGASQTHDVKLASPAEKK